MSAPKRKFQIGPLKRQNMMDPNYAHKAWKILEEGIHKIYNRNISELSFEELYRSVSFHFAT